MRRPASAFTVLALATLVACEYGAGAAPTARPRMAIHSVLNAGSSSQVVLVERTLVNGRHCSSPLGEPGANGAIAPCAVDADDPIVAAGGEPISGAEVVVYGAEGDSAVAVEDLALRGDGKGAGVYRFANGALDPSHPFGAEASLDVVPGASYRLRVTTALGTATAKTRVPFAPISSTAATVGFNVERGDVVTRGPAVAQAAAGYLAVLDAPFGRMRALFETPVTLAAFSASLFAGDLNSAPPAPRLITDLLPGVVSEARVSALDSNYVRALRAGSEEDPFSSENPGSSIDGGVGLFGSLVPLTVLRVAVVSFVDEPIEGRYAIIDGPANAPAELRIFSYRGALSGSYGPSGAAAALVGGRGVNPPVHLEFYSDRFALAVYGRFEGRYASGELIGTFAAEGSDQRLATVYRRVP